MEERSEIRRRREKIRRIALDTVKLAGLITIAVAVPNAIQGFHRLGLLPSRRQEESLRRTYQRLIQKGYLRYVGSRLRLTRKGERALLKQSLSAAMQSKRKWDGKWRVLVFDIPERKRSLRNKVRGTLQGFGFQKLQDSVWVFPHDCEDLIALFKADMRIGYSMLYMIVDEIEGQARIKELFSLK